MYVSASIDDHYISLPEPRRIVLVPRKGREKERWEPQEGSIMRKDDGV